jgi:hypothetical protein
MREGERVCQRHDEQPTQSPTVHQHEFTEGRRGELQDTQTNDGDGKQ